MVITHVYSTCTQITRKSSMVTFKIKTNQWQTYRDGHLAAAAQRTVMYMIYTINNKRKVQWHIVSKFLTDTKQLIYKQMTLIQQGHLQKLYLPKYLLSYLFFHPINSHIKKKCLNLTFVKIFLKYDLKNVTMLCYVMMGKAPFKKLHRKFKM